MSRRRIWGLHLQRRNFRRRSQTLLDGDEEIKRQVLPRSYMLFPFIVLPSFLGSFHGAHDSRDVASTVRIRSTHDKTDDWWCEHPLLGVNFCLFASPSPSINGHRGLSVRKEGRRCRNVPRGRAVPRKHPLSMNVLLFVVAADIQSRLFQKCSPRNAIECSLQGLKMGKMNIFCWRSERRAKQSHLFLVIDSNLWSLVPKLQYLDSSEQFRWRKVSWFLARDPAAWNSKRNS